MSDTPTPLLLGVAWPYANGEQHIGHIAGAYLPPDIFARYQRMAGREVLMVSGSDTHGTPITVRAENEGVTPGEIVDRFHPRFLESYQKLGITFDLFTHTDTATHWETTHDLFLRHLEKGYIYKDTQKQVFDPGAGRFLPDRYVEGTCPKCGYEEARGDQCDNCGSTYDATELKNPRSKITGSTDLEVRDTEHFFLDLAQLNEPLLEWASRDKDHWRTHVINLTRGTLEQRNLRGRPITRDISWGITIPLEGYDSKRIYVWYDAVIGYLAATKEWAQITGDPEAWRRFWDTERSPGARTYYFIGKDNIPFHTIIWPAMLHGYGGLHLPYDVPANEYLVMKGLKFSKSHNRIIGINDVLDRYQPDAWRYALTAMAPETSDSDFTWEDFVDRVNGELLDAWGNLVNRMIPFAAKRFDGRIPAMDKTTEADERLLAQVRDGFASAGRLYDAVRLRSACEEVRRLSTEVNRYVTHEAPWTVIKTDTTRAATITAVSLQCIAWLNTLWAPILPFSAQRVHEMLGFSGQLFGRQYTEWVEDSRGRHQVLRYDHAGALGVWEPVALPAGQALGEITPLVQKLDRDEVIAREVPAENR